MEALALIFPRWPRLFGFLPVGEASWKLYFLTVLPW